jgi:formylglycine-generating enzyme
MKPEIIPIPAGSFLMGCDGGQENEQPVHRVWLDAFAIGKFPVTNQEYSSYVEDQHTPPPRFWSEPMLRQPEGPVVGVSWYEALAYCAWLSKRDGRVFRLPSEAEWERAARGGLEGALYPWGDAPPSQRPHAGYDSETGGPQKVGANEANGFGLYDMSEGVHEWCSDYFGSDYYRGSPEHNPRGPAAGPRRASRGGSWRHRVKFSRCAARSSLPPDYQYADYGFRVVMTI